MIAGFGGTESQMHVNAEGYSMSVRPKEFPMKRMIPNWLTALPLLIVAAFGHAAERQATPASSIRVRDGFRVELLRSAQEGEGSWISMTMDDKGRVIVGLDAQGLGRLTLDDQASTVAFEKLEQTDAFRHVRGVLYAHESLYVGATDTQALFRLKDLDGDGQFESQELLQRLPYQSRYGHGTNQIVLGPDQMIYVVVGNDVVFPESMAEDSPYRHPRNDWLLPSPHDAGHDDRVGYIARLDAEGKVWTVVAGGFRNQVDVTFNREGEMFTWDADMEWDVGLPWYRPTRLNHVISGGEYGWRWGTGKRPAWFPDSLPSTLDTGLASPTGMVFGGASNWPERYRQALFLADWQFGRVLLVDLDPRGASYDGSADWFLEGAPLNVCDMAFGRDGALYFITGGRGSQSGLYRVTWDGSSASANTLPVDSVTSADSRTGELPTAEQSREIRRRLEVYHQRSDDSALDFIWTQLGSSDEWLRFSARVALENHPPDAWRDRIAKSENSLQSWTALLALSRVGDVSDQPLILSEFQEGAWSRSQSKDWLLPLRTLQLSLIRQGVPEESVRQQLLDRLDPLFPQDSFPANWLLQELLVKLGATGVLERSLDLMDQATTQEEQIQYAKTLTHVESEWDAHSAKRMISWLNENRRMVGGKLVEVTWRQLRADFESRFGEQLRTELAMDLNALDEPLMDGSAIGQTPRPFVKKWAMEDLVDEVRLLHPEERSIEAGYRALAAANCLRCHRLGERGSPTGPDLTRVSRRFDGRALLESVLEPSRQIDPKYAHSSFLLSDGRVVTGRTVGVSSKHLIVETDPLSGQTQTVDRETIESSMLGSRSPMPEGLLDTLTKEEVLDLLALLRRS